MSTIEDRITRTPAKLEDGTEVTIVIFQRAQPYSRYGTMQDWRKGTRVYIDEVGETVLDNLERRMGRPKDAYREAIVQALKILGIEGRVRWSQYAGCSCPCSPGFILRSKDGKRVQRHTVKDKNGCDVPVDISIQIEMGSLGESVSRNLFVQA